MRQPQVGGLLRFKRATTSSGGARRWLVYSAVFILFVYVATASWFAVRIVGGGRGGADGDLENSEARESTSPIGSSSDSNGGKQKHASGGDDDGDDLFEKERTKQKNSNKDDDSYTEDDIHIVFSTGCNLFQHWQAEVVLYSHMKVGQKGKITRVVSGCDTEAEKRAHGKFLTQ